MLKKSGRKKGKNAVGSYILTLCFIITVLFISYLYPEITGKDIFGNPCETEFAVPSSGTQDENLFRLHFIDVGQGDSTLIEAPTGENLLIDAGPNAAEDTLRAYLDRLGIKRIDYLILTHPHEDHIGGADMIINTYSVGRVIMPDVTTPTSTFEKTLDAMDQNGTAPQMAKEGDVYPFGTASFTILGPVVIHPDDLNNCSVVLRLDIGERHFLFMGDAEQIEEEEILNQYKSSSDIFSSDILKIGHHGSVSSTSDAFLQAVSPSFAVIFCEKGNDYGHPHRETRQKLLQHNITVCRTDQLGSIVFYCDGSSIFCAASISSDTVTN